MAEALASARELCRIWRVVSGSSAHPHVATGEKRHDELESALKVLIRDVGTAVTRKSERASRPMALRLVRLPFDGWRRSPEQCQKEALNALNQLDARVQYLSEVRTRTQPVGTAWPTGHLSRGAYPWGHHSLGASHHGHSHGISDPSHSATLFDGGFSGGFGDGGGGGASGCGGGGGS
jgi:uncharacterized membrane protein YgcG